jgi:hypothetical protein
MRCEANCLAVSFDWLTSTKSTKSTGACLPASPPSPARPARRSRSPSRRGSSAPGCWRFGRHRAQARRVPVRGIIADRATAADAHGALRRCGRAARQSQWSTSGVERPGSRRGAYMGLHTARRAAGRRHGASPRFAEAVSPELPPRGKRRARAQRMACLPPAGHIVRFATASLPSRPAHGGRREHSREDNALPGRHRAPERFAIRHKRFSSRRGHEPPNGSHAVLSPGPQTGSQTPLGPGPKRQTWRAAKPRDK